MLHCFEVLVPLVFVPQVFSQVPVHGLCFGAWDTSVRQQALDERLLQCLSFLHFSKRFATSCRSGVSSLCASNCPLSHHRRAIHLPPQPRAMIRPSTYVIGWVARRNAHAPGATTAILHTHTLTRTYVICGSHLLAQTPEPHTGHCFGRSMSCNPTRAAIASEQVERLDRLGIPAKQQASYVSSFAAETCSWRALVLPDREKHPRPEEASA